MQVVAVADVGGVVVDPDLHIEVAGGAAGRTCFALARKAGCGCRWRRRRAP